MLGPGLVRPGRTVLASPTRSHSLLIGGKPTAITMYYDRKTRKLKDPMQGTIIACFCPDELLKHNDCVLVDARAAERSDLELNARGEPVAPLDSLAGVVAKADLRHFLNEDIVLQDAGGRPALLPHVLNARCSEHVAQAMNLHLSLGKRKCTVGAKVFAPWHAVRKAMKAANKTVAVVVLPGNYGALERVLVRGATYVVDAPERVQAFHAKAGDMFDVSQDDSDDEWFAAPPMPRFVTSAELKTILAQ